jgi:hypothetical protein
MRRLQHQNCPLCDGTGKFTRHASSRVKEVKALREKGLTYREIMKVTGIKSLSHIFYFLKGAGSIETSK